MNLKYSDWFSSPRLMCGLMSGTSLDGIDVAIAEFTTTSTGVQFKTITHQTIPYSEEIRATIVRCIEKKITVSDISFLTVALTEFHARAVVTACAACSIAPQQLDGVGFHGQTVWHAPKPTKKLQTNLGHTLQLASGPTLAALLETVVVSDFRSALIQGKYLAKKGVWVSEFRVESGLNCGGHAFATEGYLLGPILEEFKSRKQELIDSLFELYNKALEQKTKRKFLYPPELIITVQGGIGTHQEDEFLHRHYQMTSTGWGTPFLLVPEATTVDEETLKLLCAAKKEDIVLSRNSPFGVPFHYLKGTSGEKEKQARIDSGKPGSPCTEKHLAFNTEFTQQPICTASHKYQKLKIAQLHSLGLAETEYNRQLQEVLNKECLCIGLSNAAAINYSETFIKHLPAVNICPGPNIVNFSEVVSLQTMTDHIYGRKNILANNYRPHMFITELNLYISYLKEQLENDFKTNQLEGRKKYYASFYKNLKAGIDYYQQLPGVAQNFKKLFISQLQNATLELDLLLFQYPFMKA